MGMNLVIVTKEPQEEKRRFKRKGKPIGEVGVEVRGDIWNHDSTMSAVPVGRRTIQAGSKSPDICHLEPSRHRASSASRNSTRSTMPHSVLEAGMRSCWAAPARGLASYGVPVIEEAAGRLHLAGWGAIWQGFGIRQGTS